MSDWPVLVTGSLGSLVAGAVTGLGALPVLVRPRWGHASQAIMLALAAGVMLGATVFSLIVPAMQIVSERGGSELTAALLASGGVLIGALAIWGLHHVVPHEHFVSGREGPVRSALSRQALFVIAITLHNFPEGMSVGVAYGAGMGTGIAVTTGIALQNLPEGLAVAAALLASGSTRLRAVWIALLTGLVEPVGGVLGAASVSLAQGLLPWGLSFAAGAMLFVISGEIIPETHRPGVEKRATFSLVIGFVLMMVLDVALG